MKLNDDEMAELGALLLFLVAETSNAKVKSRAEWYYQLLQSAFEKK